MLLSASKTREPDHELISWLQNTQNYSNQVSNDETVISSAAARY